MFTAQRLVATSGVTVADVSCIHEPSGWSQPEPASHRTLILIRSGLFRRRVGRRDVVLDSSTAYLPAPGTEESFAHPAGDDRCTSIAVSEDEFEALRGTADIPELIATTPQLDIAHRGLIARARSGAAADELAERAYALVGSALGVVDHSLFTAGPSRGIADGVRQLLAANRAMPLDDLARESGLSAYYLSRVFRRTTGMTITEYRIRLKLRHALDQLAAGQTDLAAVAVESGFSDQAHLTRLLRRETGTTPGSVRRLWSTVAR